MQFVALLVVVALVVKFWWLIAGIVAVTYGVYRAVRAIDRHAERVEAERRRLAEIAARADEQHRLVLAGDDRGVFGEYPPATT